MFLRNVGLDDTLNTGAGHRRPLLVCHENDPWNHFLTCLIIRITWDTLKNRKLLKPFLSQVLRTSVEGRELHLQQEQASLQHWRTEYKNMGKPASFLELRKTRPPSA